MERYLLAAALGMFAVCAVKADEKSLSIKVGTLGAGLDLTKSFSADLNGRVGLNSYNYSAGRSESGIDYDFKVELGSVAFLADWYPFHGGFHTTLGLLYNNNQASFGAKPSGTYTIGNNTYTGAEVASLNGEMAFNKTAPYIGFGWGNPVSARKTWGLVAEIGALYQREPKITLNATCGTGIPSATCTQLQNDTETERSQLESDLRSYRWYPVVSLGFSYKF